MKKTCHLILAGILLPLIFIGAGCAGFQGLKRYTGPEYEAETESWQKIIKERAGNGMWLVTRGYHTGDDLVAIATASALSHAAVLDLENQKVIEALGQGVVETDLKKLLGECHRVVLVKPRNWTPEKGNTAVAKARGKLGQKYDFLGTVGLPFTDRWYCSELAVWSMEMKVDRLGPHKVIHPKSMLKMGAVLFDTGQRDGQPDDE